MKSIEEVRAAAMTLFKTTHVANYPSMIFNPPNRLLVNLEHQVDPFISVEINAGETADMDCIGSDDFIVEGFILINYLIPIGGGTAGSAAYSDVVKNNIANRKISGVTYGPLKVFSISPYPGIVGQCNKVTFKA